MYNELLNQLEKKIQEAVEAIEMYRVEIAELKEKNDELENHQQLWEEKLSSLISKFESMNQEDQSDSAESSYATSENNPSSSYDSSKESGSEDDSQDDAEASAYSSTTTFGSQAVASTHYYSSYDE